MDTAQFAGFVLNIAEHDEIAITNHPLEMTAYEAAVALNNYFALMPLEKPFRVYGTTGDTLIVVHTSKIPEYKTVLEDGVDERHLHEITDICERQKCSD